MNNDGVYRVTIITEPFLCVTCNEMRPPEEYFQEVEGNKECKKHDAVIYTDGELKVYDTTGGKWMESFKKKE